MSAVNQLCTFTPYIRCNRRTGVARASAILRDKGFFQSRLPYRKKSRPEKPIIAPKQILVEVHFSAIDTAVDAVLKKTLMGMFVHAKPKSAPLVLGWHYSGTIVDKGADVNDNFHLEDKVWGFLQYEPDQKQGSFAEYIVVDMDDCAVVPEGVKAEELTAASTEALTALQAMRDMGDLTAGKSILVLGAGGGVGSAAVQIAKSLGAHVTGACSTKDVKRVKAFGADVVIDRTEKDPFSDSTIRYDVIFDTPNQYSATKAMGKLNPKGSYVVTTYTWSLFAAMLLSWFNGKNAKFIGCRSKREDLDLVGKLLKDRSLHIDVDSVFPVSDLEKAMERQSSDLKLGRVVIKVKDGW
jgi:NADPH:quinone reductase-like Zn-dependent oxidoreductase